MVRDGAFAYLRNEYESIRIEIHPDIAVLGNGEDVYRIRVRQDAV